MTETETLRLLRLEAVHEIQNLQGRYNHYLSMGIFEGMFDMFSKKNPNIELEIADSGVYVGHESIQRWLTESIKPKHISRGGMGLMMLLTPVIEVSRDGESARGMWHSFGCTASRTESGLRATWQQGKYDCEFVKEDGQWKFRSIHWYINFRTPFDEGWVKKQMVGSATAPGVQPDRPSTYFMPYNPDACNVYWPPPPEPES
jgi:hypothetical protein